MPLELARATVAKFEAATDELLARLAAAKRVDGADPSRIDQEAHWPLHFAKAEVAASAAVVDALLEAKLWQ
jgi:hypothetical protein